VRHVLDVIRADIDVALGLTGHTSVSALDRTALYQPAVPASVDQ
jgi:isopentenyl diphosphate isomerase/L-lactate dehydrogenase-like FMN-dependent dehydrogenase